MDHLPLSDAAILASTINRLLRDHEYEDLDDICCCFDVDRAHIESILVAGGYTYHRDLNTVK